MCVGSSVWGASGKVLGKGEHLLLLPHPPTALLRQCYEHISLQKMSLDFVWLITYGHHCTSSYLSVLYSY